MIAPVSTHIFKSLTSCYNWPILAGVPSFNQDQAMLPLTLDIAWSSCFQRHWYHAWTWLHKKKFLDIEKIRHLDMHIEPTIKTDM